MCFTSSPLFCPILSINVQAVCIRAWKWNIERVVNSKFYWNLERVKRSLVHFKDDLKHQLRSLTSVNPFAPPLELFLVSLEVFFLPAVRYLSSFSAFASASKINNVWWGWSTAVRSISWKTICTQLVQMKQTSTQIQNDMCIGTRTDGMVWFVCILMLSVV